MLALVGEDGDDDMALAKSFCATFNAAQQAAPEEMPTKQTFLGRQAGACRLGGFGVAHGDDLVENVADSIPPE